MYKRRLPGVAVGIRAGRDVCARLGLVTMRTVSADGLHNARDLGGLPVPGGETVRGVAVRTESIVNLTPEGADDLRALGVRHVLDLRSETERELDGDGVLAPDFQRSLFVHEAIPFGSGPQEYAELRHRSPAEVAFDWCAWLEEVSFRLAEALSRAAWSTTPLIVSSATGSERASVVSAMLLDLAGTDRDSIVDDHLLSREALPRVVMRLAERPAYWGLDAVPWTSLEPSSDSIVLLLRHLARWGGTRGWLLQHGADPETIDLLRGRLTGEPIHIRHVG